MRARITLFEQVVTAAVNAVRVWREEGFFGIRERVYRRFLTRKELERYIYRAWIQKYERLSLAEEQSLRLYIQNWSSPITISILMPVYNTPPQYLERAIWSVRKQSYPHWELCISDDASSIPEVREILSKHISEDARIRASYRTTNGHISANSNSAFGMAKGEFVALLDADDELASHALFWVAEELRLHPNIDLLFSDEDKIDERSNRFEPHFKGDWNPALMLGQNAFSHLGVFRRTLVEEVKGFRIGYEGSQDYDLVLRCADRCGAERIRHIPRILYHWRATVGSSASASGIQSKPYAATAAIRAVQDHIDRNSIRGRARSARGKFRFAEGQYQRIEYDITDTPRISIVIPTAFHSDLIVRCLHSILSRTTYQNYEVVVTSSQCAVDAAKQNQQVRALLENSRVQTLIYGDGSFNYSKVNNWVIGQTSAPVICLLNDDTEVITIDWLEQLAARIALPKVAAVGAMLLYPDDTIQHAGVILGIGGVAGHAFARLKRGHPGYFGRAILDQDVSCVTAACMVLRRDVFLSVGGFREDLAIAYNDVDLCLKFRTAGFRVIWTPRVELYHRESASVGRHDSPARKELYKAEHNLMRNLWDKQLDNDQFYNPNLSLRSQHFAFFEAPRLTKLPF